MTTLALFKGGNSFLLSRLSLSQLIKMIRFLDLFAAAAVLLLLSLQVGMKKLEKGSSEAVLFNCCSLVVLFFFFFLLGNCVPLFSSDARASRRAIRAPPALLASDARALSKNTKKKPKTKPKQLASGASSSSSSVTASSSSSSSIGGKKEHAPSLLATESKHYSLPSLCSGTAEDCSKAWQLKVSGRNVETRERGKGEACVLGRAAAAH